MYVYILLFLLVPAIEIGVFVWTGSKIGAGYVVLGILLSGIIGIWLVRQQGIETMRNFQSTLQDRQVPKNELLDGLCIILGGIMLVIPGFVTDLIGFLLVIPFTRKPFKYAIYAFFMRKVAKRKIIYRKF
ncbi:FxsA family protein [Pseudogracilibacillus sp. ICA-222130]|uniref:FxsA family protein n=1 Tax=Pseudogracilibacillus sp. ICA-222130 TaxID=3134655 RepID=UPI0030BF7662